MRKQLIDKFPDKTYGMTGNAKTVEQNAEKTPAEIPVSAVSLCTLYSTVYEVRWT